MSLSSTKAVRRSKNGWRRRKNSVLYEIRMKERDFDLADPQGKSDFFFMKRCAVS